MTQPMRRFTSLLLALLIGFPATVHSASKVRIAVMDFTAKGGIEQSQLDVLTDVVANEIRSTRLYDVLSKADIQSMLSLEEQKQLAGCDEASCLAEIGGALGVEYLVTGNVGKFGDVFAVNLKLLNTRKARVENSVFHKVSGGEMALLDDLPVAIRELLGIGGAAATPQTPVATPAAAVSYDAAERELTLLGFTHEQLARFRDRKLLIDFDLPRLAAKLHERGFTSDDISSFLLDHDLLDRPLEDRLKWVLFYASGLKPRLWRHYKRSRIPLTEYYNDAQESTALEVLQWIALGLGAVFVIGSAAAYASDGPPDLTAKERKDAESVQIGMMAGGSALVVAGVVMFSVDLLDRGQLPEGFFEKATKKQIIEQIPEAAELFDRAPRVGLAPWIEGDHSGGLAVVLSF